MVFFFYAGPLTDECIGSDVQHHQAGVELEHLNEEFSPISGHSTGLKVNCYMEKTNKQKTVNSIL